MPLPIRKLLFVLTLCSAICTQAHGESKLVEFKISGGRVVKCPMATDTTPELVRSGLFSLGFPQLMPVRDETGWINLVTVFRMYVRPERKDGKLTYITVTRITVEDVSNATAVMVIDDKLPKIRDEWKSNTPPVLVKKSSAPWVFDGKNTSRIFRITISAQDVPNVILYQPVFYSVAEKRRIVQMLPRMQSEYLE